MEAGPPWRLESPGSYSPLVRLRSSNGGVTNLARTTFNATRNDGRLCHGSSPIGTCAPCGYTSLASSPCEHGFLSSHLHLSCRGTVCISYPGPLRMEPIQRISLRFCPFRGTFSRHRVATTRLASSPRTASTRPRTRSSHGPLLGAGRILALGPACTATPVWKPPRAISHRMDPGEPFTQGSRPIFRKGRGTLRGERPRGTCPHEPLRSRAILRGSESLNSTSVGRGWPSRYVHNHVGRT